MFECADARLTSALRRSLTAEAQGAIAFLGLSHAWACWSQPRAALLRQADCCKVTILHNPYYRTSDMLLKFNGLGSFYVASYAVRTATNQLRIVAGSELKRHRWLV